MYRSFYYDANEQSWGQRKDVNLLNAEKLQVIVLSFKKSLSFYQQLSHSLNVLFILNLLVQYSEMDTKALYHRTKTLKPIVFEALDSWCILSYFDKPYTIRLYKGNMHQCYLLTYRFWAAELMLYSLLTQ